ncbi:MAG: DUF2079 domain-containing protein [Byssovorax sp.]
MLSRARAKLSDVAASLDGLTQRLAATARTWALWPALYAIATGVTLWQARHPGTLATIESNKLPLKDTLWLLAWVLSSLLGFALIHLFTMLARRRKTGRWDVLGTFGALNGRLAFLLALPFLPALALPGIEKDSPKLASFFIVLVAVAAGRAYYAWIKPAEAEPALPEPDELTQGDGPPPARPGREKLHKALAALAIVGLWVGYGLFFSRLSITNHHALNTRTIDLGYYDNIFYQSIHGRPLACSMIRGGYHGSAHFDPLLILLSPLYLIYPRAELILVLQSVWIGAGVVPLYLIGRDKLGRRAPAVAIAAMYALYPALQGANMYEFHSLSLISPLIFWLLYFFEKGSYRAYWLMLVPTLLCREDASLLVCFIALYAILTRRPKAARLGWITILVSLAYLVVVKRFFMASSDLANSGKDSYSFAYYYEDLIPNKNGVAGIVLSLVTNPIFTVKTVVADAKINFFLVLFVPLLFLPFAARTARVMLVYGLLFCFLASRSAVFTPSFQYSNLILSVAFAMTPAAVVGLEEHAVVRALGLDGKRVSRAAVGAMLVASLLVAWKFGGLVENQAFRGGFGRVARELSQRDKDTYAWLDEQVARVPMNVSVGVTNKTGPHISNRKDVTFYPDGKLQQWVLVDEGELKGGDLEKHNKYVQQGKVVLVSRHEKLALFKQPGAPGRPEPDAAPKPTATIAPAGSASAVLAPPRIPLNLAPAVSARQAASAAPANQE